MWKIKSRNVVRETILRHNRRIAVKEGILIALFSLSGSLISFSKYYDNAIAAYLQLRRDLAVMLSRTIQNYTF
jgi:hypothetical protein